MEAWRTVLRGDPLPWLLEKETPAVRHLTLGRLLDELPDSAAVRRARAAAMAGVGSNDYRSRLWKVE